MNCSLYRTSLMEAARGGKAGREALAHANECAACREFLANQKRVTRGARGLAAEAFHSSLPEGLESELLAEFEAVRTVAQRPRWYWMTAGGLALAASVIAGVLTARAPWELMGQPEIPAVQRLAVQTAPPRQTQVAAVTLPPSPGRPEPPKPSPKPTIRFRQSTPAPPAEEAFVSIPYTMPLAPGERADVVRMDVPVAALISAGLNVGVRDMSASANADVLVGEDGRARAVRLISVSDSTSFRSYK